MSTSAIRDSVDKLKETARDAYEDLKETAQDRVLNPLAETGRNVAAAARHRAEDVADFSRRSVDRAGTWVSDNPFSAAGIAFGSGIVLGALLLARCKR